MSQIFSAINKKIGPHNYNQDFYLLMGEINEETIAPVIEYIISNNFPNGEEEPMDVLNLMICSGGGEVGPAFALIDVMQGSAVPVRTIGFGSVGSAALMIFMAGAAGQRVLTPNSMVLSHQWSWGNGGKAHELEATAKAYKLSSSIILNHYVKSTKLNEEEVKRILLPPSDVWLSANECKKYGICDIVSNLK
jgi:ATP-dependent Clp protease protease subunit